ncbi:hypothetical protein F8388_015375 [Cannabis sativa]|uniref:Micronuclear linker histone polyprotein n=1 Tax=Cannabis sativa TaxID=3483 RepID=A0A7J6GI48_CANSA|nr:hypothetical protein F8388_015375 [Cannabis sativa]
MAVGGYYNKGNGSSGNSNRGGRPYGLMLLVAFGAALFGRERDYTKEAKMKNEELKAKIFSLRMQKMEIERRVVEMQSTIESLKDEGKTMEGAIEEKQNEIKMLRLQQQHSTTTVNNDEKDNSQVMALTQTLKQKEAQIEDFKRLLQYPEKKDLSISTTTDDPSKGSVNLTLAEDQKVKTVVHGEGESSNKTVMGEVSDDRRKMMSNEKEKFEHLQDRMNKRDGVIANSSDVISQNGGKRTDNNDESKNRGNGQTSKHESRKNLATIKGGMKLEIRDGSSNNVESIARGTLGSVSSNSKGKRWRLMAKNSRSEKNGKQNRVKIIKSSRLEDEDDRVMSKGGVKKAASVGIPMPNNHRFEAKIPESLSLKNRTGDEEQQPSKKFQTSLARETPLNTTTVGEQSETGMQFRDKKPEVRKLQDANAVEQGMSRTDIGTEMTDDLEGLEDYMSPEEPENFVSDDESSSKAGFSAKENKEYKEEIDEPEF